MYNSRHLNYLKWLLHIAKVPSQGHCREDHGLYGLCGLYGQEDNNDPCLMFVASSGQPTVPGAMGTLNYFLHIHFLSPAASSQ